MDRHLLATRLAVRRSQVFVIEDRLLTACERAAGHGQHGHRPPPDRRAWDRHTWHRYLREAVSQERELGPALRASARRDRYARTDVVSPRGGLTMLDSLLGLHYLLKGVLWQSARCPQSPVIQSSNMTPERVLD